ncbi:class I SAM-dependent methyltransferase [Geminicoccaceae bacterium 1502E]|nr:class I SAM-dependent methyltransferase [Geminicoccaceae bacterium 1502E]
MEVQDSRAMGAVQGSDPATRPAGMRERFFPEVAAGGFTRVDGTIEFYTRINALLRPEMTLVDFGAGRGAALHDDTCAYRRNLRNFRGKVAKVVGLDVDPVVMHNPGLDEAHVIPESGVLPLSDASADIIVSDFTFEHVPDAEKCAAELGRILKPGGWLCARTPNRWGYVALLTQLIPDRMHGSVLRRVQPDRKEQDVFPTCYRMNTMKTVRKLFPATGFRDASYTFSPEPAYLPQRAALWRAVLAGERLLPPLLHTNLFIFLQKRLPHP